MRILVMVEMNKDEEKVKDPKMDVAQIHKDFVYAKFPKPPIVKENLSIHSLDFYYSLFSWYDWNNTSNQFGANFTPVKYRIDELRKIGISNNLLDSIERRTFYLNVQHMELEYILERYQWEKIPTAYNFFLSRFENNITMICELYLLTIDLYQKNSYPDEWKEKLQTFKEVFDFFKNSKYISSFYKPNYLNPMMEYTMYIFIRNSMVHNPLELEYKNNNQNPLLSVKNIEYKRRYGDWNKYLDNLFSQYTGRKIPKDSIFIIDKRFPYYQFNIKLTNKCKINYQDTIIGLEIPMLDYSNMMINELFRLQPKFDT